jgi:hypothetical protein
MSQQTTAPRPIATKQQRRVKSGWLAIAGLLLLSALPVLGGVLSLSEASAHAAGSSSSASPLPMIAHVVGMSVFCLLGAFQFSPALRVRRGWHRSAGRVLIPAGFVAALSSIWLAVFFGGPANELALAMVRLGFAVPMTVFLVLGSLAIKRRDFAAHGAWMTRAYAIAVSGGSQALVFALWTLGVGEVDASGEAGLIAAAFVLNSVVAELIILRRARASAASRRHSVA